MQMDDRKRRILRAIIDDYILTVSFRLVVSTHLFRVLTTGIMYHHAISLSRLSGLIFSEFFVWKCERTVNAHSPLV